MRVVVQCEGTVPGRSCGIENFLYGLLGGLAELANGEHEVVVSVPKGTRQAWQAALGAPEGLRLVEVAATAALPPLFRVRTLARRIAPVRKIVRGLRLRVEARALTAIEPDVVYYPWHLGDGAASPAVVTIHDLREEQPLLLDQESGQPKPAAMLHERGAVQLEQGDVETAGLGQMGQGHAV